MADVESPDVIEVVVNNSTTEAPWYYDEWLDPFEVSTSCFSTVITIPTIILTILMGRHYLQKGFKSSFQKLFFLLMINDLLCVFMQMIVLRLPWWGIFSFYGEITEGIVPTTLSYLIFTVRYIQILGCNLIALNRACSVGIPRTYERIWTKFFFPILLYLLLFPQVFTLRMFFEGGAYYYKFAPSAYLIFSKHPDEAFYGVQMCVVGMIVTTFTLFLNLFTGLKLYDHMKTMNQSRQLKELRFFHQSVVMFMCQVLATVVEFFIQYGTGDLKTVCMQASTLIYDFNSLVPIYMLIVLSKETRSILFPGREESRVTTVTVSSTVTVSKHNRSKSMPA